MRILHNENSTRFIFFFFAILFYFTIIERKKRVRSVAIVVRVTNFEFLFPRS